MKIYGFQTGKSISDFSKKLLLAMKITTFFILITIMHVSASSYAQKITLSENNAQLKTIFKEIKNQTGYNFIYTEGELKTANPVTIKANAASLNSVLDKIFEGQPLTYTIIDNVIVVKEKERIKSLPINIILRVTGKVVDKKGLGIPSVTIKIKNGKKAVATDVDGNFVIEANEGDILVFSSIGYSTKEVKVGTEAIQIQLDEQSSPLDEVVVGSNVVATTRRAETSSTTVFTAKDLERIPSNNLNDIFTGYVPGAFAPQLGQDGSARSSIGTPFGNLGGTLTIRGANGVGGVTPIKVYVDGIEQSEGSDYIGTIDKNSIDKIEIVRGSSAATLYGSGANGGVILITTKKAYRKQTNLNIGSSAGFINSKWVTQKAFQQEQTFNISQGLTDNINYLIGGNLHSIGAYLPFANQKDAGVYGNLNVKLSDKLNITINGRYSSNYQHFYRTPVFDAASLLPGVKDFYYYAFDTLYTASRSGVVSGGININYNPTSWWKHNITAGYSQISSQYGLDGSAKITTAYLQNTGFSVTNYVSNRPSFRYNNSISIGRKDNVALNILSGYEYSSYDYHTQQENVQYSTFKKIYRINSFYDPGNKVTNHGVFAQAALSYLDKYFLTFAYRFEKSNVFQVAANNPKLGITTNFDFGDFIFKPRIQYGIGITLPPYDALHPIQGSDPNSVEVSNPDIQPSSQRGFDYGLEVFSKGGEFKFEAVYYRYNLTNSFGLQFDGFVAGQPQHYKWVNRPPARNDGIELSANYNGKNGLRLSSTFSLVNSISTTDNTRSYYQNLRTPLKKGDRLPFVVKYTFAENVGYDFKRVFGSADKLGITVSAIGSAKGLIPDLYNFDIAVAEYFTTFTGDYPTYKLVNYPTIVRVNLALEYHVLPNLIFFTTVKNILNNNNSELGPIYPVQGANWLFGLRYHFSK